MQPYCNNSPIGPEVFVSTPEVAPTAERMFANGADEVRVSKLGGTGYTKSPHNKTKRKAKNKAARMARKRNR